MNKNRLLPLTLLVCLTAASCKLPAPEIINPTATDPGLLFTSAASTADAIRMGKGENVPTLKPEVLIKSLSIPTQTPTQAGSLSTPSDTPAPTNTPLELVPTASEDYRAEFVADISIPDASEFAPGEKFTKTWRIKNNGEKVWSPEFSIVYAGGDLIGGPGTFPLPARVAPGEEVDISVGLHAPNESGSYRGEWKIKTDRGSLFGVGAEGEKPFWVEIVVLETGEEGTEGRIGREGIIRNLELSVDQDEVASVVCPHTFVFNADFDLGEEATVTYQLEAQTPDYIYEIRLPPPLTKNLKPGGHKVVYELEFDNDIRGWARLVFLTPDEVKSQEVNFSLDCR